jgi:hypothetical protein
MRSEPLSGKSRVQETRKKGRRGWVCSCSEGGRTRLSRRDERWDGKSGVTSTISCVLFLPSGPSLADCITQCGCPGCALRCCATFTEWAKNRRLTVVSHETRPPPYLWWGDNKESDASKICRAIDVVRCSEERGGDSEIRRVGGGFVGLKGKGVFVERMERNWLFLKIVSPPIVILRYSTD